MADEKLLPDVLLAVLKENIGALADVLQSRYGLAEQLAAAAVVYKTDRAVSESVDMQKATMYEGTLMAIATDDLAAEDEHNPARAAATVLTVWGVHDDDWVAEPTPERVADLRSVAQQLKYDLPPATVRYRVGNHSPVNMWREDGEHREQIGMACSPEWARRVVRALSRMPEE